VLRVLLNSGDLLCRYLVPRKIVEFKSLFLSFCIVELELQQAERYLEDKKNRKEEFKEKVKEINERKTRKWLVQHGKKNLLAF